MVGGQRGGGGGGDGRRTIFLESFAWGRSATCCVHVRLCVCVCVEVQEEVCRRHVCVCRARVCVACVCLCLCVSRVINTAVGAVTRAEKMRKFPQAERGPGEGDTLG